MTKILCLLFAINCLVEDWYFTGFLLLWIVFFKTFK